MDTIDSIYMPFSVDDLKSHFTGDADKQIEYLLKSASNYHDFMSENSETSGIPLTESRKPRQMEKDERFWTLTATKNIFDKQSRTKILAKLLAKTFGLNPPIKGMEKWEECLDGDLKLYFEAQLPSSQSYREWLRENLEHRQIIPYVLDAAGRVSARALEGATHVDAMLLNVDNGFAWLIEAKVLSDVSCSISFDSFRNQIARNIDVMLDNASKPGFGLEKRDPEKSLFSLLTPAMFKQYPSSRLYGWLIEDYKSNPDALKRDLPHRKEMNWAELRKRIGWVTFEDFEEVQPGACPWLYKK